MKPIPGMTTCGNHSCLFGHPGGQGTNGGCHCLVYPLDRTDLRRIHCNVQRMKARIEVLERGEEELAELRAIRDAANDFVHMVDDFDISHAIYCNGVHGPSGECEGAYWWSRCNSAMHNALAAHAAGRAKREGGGT